MSGFFGFQLLLDVLKSVGNIHLGSYHHVCDQHDRRTVCMVRRKYRNCVLRKINIVYNVSHIPNNGVCTKHNALALTGGSGSIYEQRKLSFVKLKVEIRSFIL